MMRFPQLGDVQVGDIVKGLIYERLLRITKKETIESGDLKGHTRYTAVYLEGPEQGTEVTLYNFMAYKKEA